MWYNENIKKPKAIEIGTQKPISVFRKNLKKEKRNDD